MRGSRIIVVAIVVLMAVLPIVAGKKKKKDKGESAAAPTADVAAYVEGAQVSLAQIDESIQGQLSKVRTEEYTLRRTALNQLIDEMLLENEAKTRGVAVDELIKTEVDAKAGEVTEQEIQRFYDANKGRNRSIQGKSLEQVTPMIRQTLEQQKAASRRRVYVSELRAQSDVKVMLQPPRAKVSIPEGEPTKGPEDAPIVMVEFSDYQCPYCKRAEATVTKVLEEYGDKIHLVFRDYPLAFHDRGVPAAVAARCAGKQDKYWEYHDNLTEINGNLSDEDLRKRAQDLQLEMEAFTACYDSNEFEPVVQASMQDASALGVTGTPTFFINGRMLVGAKPFQEFKAVIDEELAFAETDAGTGG
jgi:protein-disulfide isomerase